MNKQIFSQRGFGHFLLVASLALLAVSFVPFVQGQSKPLLPSTVDTLSAPLVVMDESDHLYVDLHLFQVKFFKGASGYNSYTKNGSALVANEQWILEYFSQSQWKQRGTPRSLEWTQLSEFHVQVKRFYDDFAGTIFWVIFDVYSQDKIKVSVNLFAGQTDDYRLTWKASGINTDFLDHDTSNRIVECFDDPESLAVGFNYSDVYQEFGDVTDVTLEGQAKDRKATMTFGLGVLESNQNVVVDPSVVAEDEIMDATYWSYQRKTFFANGRYWIFYSNQTAMLSKTSTDGLTWSNATKVRNSTDGYQFSVWFNGTYIHYAYAPGTAISGSGEPLTYRRGVPQSNGTITWSTSEQTAYTTPTGNNTYRAFVSVDSSGYPWIGYQLYNGTNLPFVTKSAWNNGSWSTESGFPFCLLGAPTASWAVTVIPLTSNRVYAFYVRQSTIDPIKGRLWNGTSWGSEEDVTSRMYSFPPYSAVAVNDDVHLVFLNRTTYEIVYAKRTNATGWATEQALATGVLTSYPVVSVNGSDLFVFWAKENTMYHRRYNGSWQSAVAWFTYSSIEGKSVNAFYNMSGTELAVMWTTDSSPYKVMFQPWRLLQVTLSASKTSATSGEVVTISWTIIRVYDGSEVTDFKINITKNGAIWQTNLTSSSVEAVEVTYDKVTKTFGVSDVLDNTYGMSVFESNTVAVTWTREWKESGAGGGGGGAEEKKEPLEEFLEEVLQPVLATITSQYVGLAILSALILLFGVAWWKQNFALKLVFGTASILFFFNLLCVWVLVPMAILPSEAGWLQPMFWEPPSLTLTMFRAVATEQAIQIVMIFVLFGIFGASAWGLTHRD